MNITNGFVPGTRGGKKVWLSTDIVDVQEIMRRTGRKRTAFYNWLQDPAFPPPVIRLGQSDGWYWPDVMNWINERSWENWDPRRDMDRRAADARKRAERSAYYKRSKQSTKASPPTSPQDEAPSSST